MSATHWDGAYQRNGAESVSWFEPRPALSLQLIAACGLGADAPMVDIGGGASGLALGLLELGYQHLTVLDISAQALALARDRMGAGAARVDFVVGDATDWQPKTRFALWHDRAVFHFLTESADRARYMAILRASVLPGGFLVMASFAPDGPERCSGLPVRRYDADLLAAELGSAFALVETHRHAHRTPGGAVQNFMYARYQRAV